MSRTRLRNTFIDSKTYADRIVYSKQRNYCVSLIRKEKKPITVILTLFPLRGEGGHINNLCKKASQKLNALARSAPYICLEKRKTVMKAYITSQFGYCPLVWMFHSRSLNNKINSLHERALRITYGDRSSSFENLLKKDNSVSIDHRNIQALATEMFKAKDNIAPEIMKKLFAPKMSSYDLRNNDSFKRRRVNSVWHGTESVSYLGPKIWDLVPNEIKESESLNGFKFKIKRWVPEGCPCRICKIYLGQVGFIVT